MGDGVEGAVSDRISDLSRDVPAQLSETERVERAGALQALADQVSGGGDHPVEVALIRDLARRLATADTKRFEAARSRVNGLLRAGRPTEDGEGWYELEYVYSQQRIEDLEDYTMRRLADPNCP